MDPGDKNRLLHENLPDAVASCGLHLDVNPGLS